jgi:hypothetical protein
MPMPATAAATAASAVLTVSLDRIGTGISLLPFANRQARGDAKLSNVMQS